MSESEKPSRPPLVLVANDQEWSARSLESILGPNGYAVLRAYTGRQTIDLARSARPDVIILDLRLPDIDGLDVCRTLREDARLPVHTPIIVTNSGPSDRAQVLAAYKAGAWECCSQPYDGELLLLKLESFVRAKLELDRVRDESLLDQNTGLYNARGLARRAREIGAEACRQHNSLACVAISADVGPDGISSDAMAHLAAQVAAHFGGVFRRTGRLSDAFGRLGQQEFAIVAPATEAKGAERLVQRLQESLALEPFALEDGGERRLTIRAGYCAVADLAESSVDAVEMLLRAATALRQLRADGNASATIRAFDEPSLRYVQ